ncbi:hypothetical protein C0992_003876 [Termitomyces sp. T32_za158]|nr:hypothetical protein C0992_003876 [Termitomyces sp. T32_za158]
MFQQLRRAPAVSTSSDSPTSSGTEPPTTPLQQKRLPTSLMSASQKRLKLIQEALEVPSSSAHSEDRTPGSSLSSPSKSKKRFEDIQLALDATNTSHVLACPPSPTPHRIISSQPSVPHGREVGKSSANINPEKTDDEDAELWDCLTPPRIQDVFLGTHVGAASTEPSSQETVAGPSCSNWRDDEPDDPFDQSSQLYNSISKTIPCIPALTSFNSASPEQSAETSTKVFVEMSELVTKLQRRLLASEKGNSAKARRICELEEIIERSLVSVKVSSTVSLTEFAKTARRK